MRFQFSSIWVVRYFKNKHRLERQQQQDQQIDDAIASAIASDYLRPSNEVDLLMLGLQELK